MILNIIVIICGLIISIFIFNKFPYILEKNENVKKLKVSIVIPARNEEYNLPNLLNDIKNQDYEIHEVICVDDDSSDGTEEIINKFNATLISIKDKPDEWTGKSWACQKGVEVATGDLILFLDADVRLSQKAVSKLIGTYLEYKCTLSIQPYHKTEKIYEQLSLFFNIVQLSANAVTFPIYKKSIGLYGPLILISKEEYNFIGSHSSVKESIIEDVSLGQNLKKCGLKFKLFMGGKDVTFRMYPEGFGSLFQGWSKNFATGAAKTNFLIFVLVFWWLTACASTTINLIYGLVDFDWIQILIYGVLYILWIIEIFRISIKSGKYMKWGIILYPIPLLAFFVIFIFSLFKKIFRLKTTWKKRKIKL